MPTEPKSNGFPFDDPRYKLSKILNDGMTPEQVAIQALDGVEFSSLAGAQAAVRSVAAAIEIMTRGPIQFGPSLVS